jgi:two-component system sensor histidine kinase UhpB
MQAMPIFWRILLTNLFVVLGGAVLGTYLTQRFVQRGEFTNAMHVAMVVIAIGLSALITWLGIHNAFRPLRELRRAIDRFNRGEGAATIELAGGDPDTREVARAVNQLWTQLEQTNAIVAEQNRRLTALTAQVISAQEDERRRIARELHDEAGQALTALIIGLERGEQAMTGEHLAVPRQTVARLRDLAIGTLEEIRTLAHDLRPSLLDDLGLVAAIRWYARTCATRANVSVNVTVEGLDDDERLGSEIETTVFRIVQEGLTNVLKHARAEHACVRLTRDQQGLTVVLDDDGVGIGAFDVGQANESGRLGIVGMTERSRLVGGTIEVGERVGGGTHLSLRVPRADAEPAPRRQPLSA